MVVAPDTMQVGMLEGIAHRDPREALPRGEDQLAAGPPERTEQNSANASRGPDFLQTGESFRSGGVEMEVLDLVAEPVPVCFRGGEQLLQPRHAFSRKVVAPCDRFPLKIEAAKLRRAG